MNYTYWSFFYNYFIELKRHSYYYLLNKKVKKKKIKNIIKD